MFSIITRNFSSVKKNFGASAISVFNNSCYHKIDFKINEDMCAKEAVNRFAAFNVGCLAVVDSNSKVTGVISERDYINKVAALGKNDLEIKVKDICSSGAILVARPDDSPNQCMNKMLLKDIRHLLIIDDNNKDFVGMISIKDLIKEIQKESHETITKLTDFRLGKGAFFGSE